MRTRNLDVKALQAVFELLQSHYPERLHALWFLNAPFIFWGVWRMVKPPWLAVCQRVSRSHLFFACPAGAGKAILFVQGV